MQKDNLFSLKEGFYIVTGGLGLLGKMHCEAILEYGGTPVIFDIESKDFNSYKKYLKEISTIEPIFIKTDITNESSIKEAISKLREKDLPIKGLINNAARNPSVSSKGLQKSNRLEEFCIDEWNNDIQVGLTGAFLCTKIIGSYMNQNLGGNIINISSDLGIIAPNQDLYKDDSLKDEEQFVKPISYSVVKSGLIGLTRYTSTYWPDKVRCNCLCPGGIYVDQPDDFLEKISELIPMKRMAQKNEYKGSIVFLLSDASSYMTGSIISVDGGRTAW
tara:strand:+ start:138 stop:962 length:825 start_codon:yes stop_codon:yes gene_type:complete